jgi:hypothetical protein
MPTGQLLQYLQMILESTQYLLPVVALVLDNLYTIVPYSISAINEGFKCS